MDPEFSLDDAPSLPGEVSEAAEAILGQMPEVQQHAIDQHNAETQAAEDNAERDANGEAFDPNIHTGTKLKDGTWRRKRGARNPSFVAPSRRSAPSAAGSAQPATAVDSNAEALATGTVIASMILSMCHSIGGDEWQPTDHEREFQTAAWQQYCVAKNMKELSPGLMVFVATGSYALPRFTKPKTQQKLSRLRVWFALRIAKRKLKNELRKRGLDLPVTIENGVLKIDGRDVHEVLQ